MKINKAAARIFVFLLCLSVFAACIPCEVTAIQGENGKTVRVGFFEFDGYHMQDSNGIRSGYGYDILQYMAGYENWNLEYVGYDKNWSEMQDMLEAGEIDILTSAQKTPERSERFNFSQKAIGVSSAILTVKAGNSAYIMEDYIHWSGIRVGLLKDNSRNESFERFAETYGFTYTAVYYEDTDEMLKALDLGEEIDAVVTSNLRKTENEWILAQFDASPFYIMTKKGNTKLEAEVNSALNQLFESIPEITNLLMSRYYTSTTGENIAFTEEERDIVAASQKKPIKIGVVPSSIPICYLDGESGEYSGISMEVLKAVSNKTGLSFKYIPVDLKTNTPIAWLKQGSYELVAGVLKSTKFLSDGELVLSEKLMEDTLAMVGRKGDDFTQDPTNRTIAVLKGFQVANEYAEMSFPDHKIVQYDTWEECLDAVVTGEADASPYIRIAASYSLQNPHYQDLEILTTYSQNIETCVAGLSKDKSAIVGIINKGLAMMSESERNAIMMNYTVLNPYKATLSDLLYEFRVPLAAVAILLIIVVVGLWVVASLKRKNSKALKLAADTANEYRDLLQKTYDMTIENMPNYVAKWLFKDGDVLLTYANQKYLDFINMTAYEAIGKSIVYGFRPEGMNEFIKSLYEFEKDKKNILVTNKAYKENGDVCWLRIQASFFETQEGNSVYYGTLTDITELIETQENLRISEEEYKIAAALSEHSILRFDIRKKSITVLSQGSSAFNFSNILGTNPESIISGGFIAPTSYESYRKLCSDIMKGIDSERVSLQVFDKEGKSHWCDVEHNTIRDNEGIPATSIISLEDVTSQKQAEELFNISTTFMDSAKNAKKLLVMNLTTGIIEYENSGPHGFLTKDAGSTQIQQTKAFTIRNYVAEEDAEACSRFFDPNRLLQEYEAGNLEEKFEYRGIDENGEIRWNAVDSRKVYDAYSGDIKVYFIFSDIHDDKTSKIDLMRRATRDALTGLMNRESFEAEIYHRIDKSREENQRCAVIMIDIDKFKSVNDTFGHDIGDDALKGVAARLKASFRENDVVARFGGDEFIALLPNITDTETIAKICDRVCRNMNFTLTENFTVSGSLGIAIYPEDGLDYGELRRKADAAMYDAKAAGGNGYAFYTKA